MKYLESSSIEEKTEKEQLRQLIYICYSSKDESQKKKEIGISGRNRKKEAWNGTKCKKKNRGRNV